MLFFLSFRDLSSTRDVLVILSFLKRCTVVWIPILPLISRFCLPLAMFHAIQFCSSFILPGLPLDVFSLVFPFPYLPPHLVRLPSSKYLVTSLVVLRYFQKPDHYNCQSGNISGPVFDSRLEQTNNTCQSSNFNGAVFAYFSFCFNY